MFNKVTWLSAMLTVFITGTASAITVWVPTDGNMNILSDTNYEAQGIEFGIFDDSNMALDEGLGYLPFHQFDTIVVTPDVGGDWLFTNSDGDSLVLSDSSQFLIAANDGGGWGGDSGYTELGPSGAYDIELMGGAVVIRGVDLAPIPLPAALWLFGSGLLGLVGMIRRRSA